MVAHNTKRTCGVTQVNNSSYPSKICIFWRDSGRIKYYIYIGGGFFFKSRLIRLDPASYLVHVLGLADGEEPLDGQGDHREQAR